MRPRLSLLRRVARIAAAVAGLALLAGCEENARLDHSLEAIPSDTLALMQEKGVTTDAPILIRSYKQEAEFEVWKRKPDGRYVYLKTFPMCRWSGQLGPKTREGDRQVPEGFYSVTPGAMNPNSQYYLSFNVGYPNAYDRVHGATGGSIMVHGICSSAGCFSMTNEQIGEIYALAREAFNGGQPAIQMQSLPFRMTAKNLAKHRADPYMPFWRNLKEGADNFEVTRQEPIVGVCGKHYVFNAQPASGRFEPDAPCPKIREDESVKADVAAREQRDDAAVAALVTKGEKAVRTVYVDGGQNPVFRGKYADTSRPDALMYAPTEVAIDDTILEKSSKLNARSRNPRLKADAKTRFAKDAPVDSQPTSTIVAAAPPAAAADQPLYRRVLNFTASEQPATENTEVSPPATSEAAPLYKRLLGLAPDAAPAPPAVAPGDGAGKQAAAVPEPVAGATARATGARPATHAKRKPRRDEPAKVVDGASPGISPGFVALAAASK